jgi:hypothetical protein
MMRLLTQRQRSQRTPPQQRARSARGRASSELAMQS